MNDLLGLQRLALLGRDEEIKRIEAVVRRCQRAKQAQIVFIGGQGGIGKTHLLRHIKQLAKGRSWHVSEDILDLDNPEYATPWGLARGIVIAAAGGWEKAPKKIQKAWDNAYQSLRRGNLNTLQENWSALEKELRRYLQGKIPDKGIFIFRLDTAERLREAIEDEKPETEQRTGDEQSTTEQRNEYPWELSIGRWLTRLLEQTQNFPILWLMAGRPTTLQTDVLLDALRQAFGNRLQIIKLEALPEEARGKYLTHLAEAIESSDPEGAKRLRTYLRAHSKAFSQATQGYPLYMALAADLLRLGENLPPAFCASEDFTICVSKNSESKDNPPLPAEARTLAEEIHKNLMQTLIAEQSALGYVLEKMARARLGSSEAMLNKWWNEALAIGLNAPPGWRFEELKNRLQNLVTVKHFPHRRRAYFLHDEIYDFINKTWPLENKGSRKPILEKVLQDYEEEQHGQLSLAYRHQIEAEEIYYRVWHAPWVGYPHYLAEANDWAKTSPLAFRRLIRYMQRLRRWMLETEGRKDEEPFWDFWQLEHRFHEAALWGGRYEDVRKAREILPVNLPETSPSPQIPLVLHALQALTKALLAYYEKQAIEERNNLQKAENILQELKTQWDKERDKKETTRLLQAILDNHYGMWYRRQGQMRKAQNRYHQALRTLRRYRLEGTAGVLINLAYVEILLSHSPTAEGLLQEAKHRANPTDKKTAVRLHNVSTFHYALIENPKAADTAKRVLQICAEEDYPRFRALTLMHWARALRGEWNAAMAWSADIDETLPKTIIAGLRRVLPKNEVAKIIEGLGSEEPYLEMWDRAFGKLSAPICVETAWELKKHLRPDETAELYREIGRLWREWGWARHRQGKEKTAQRLGKAAETYFWYAATGQTTPPQVWWEEEKDKIAEWINAQEKKVGPFPPLAAFIDLLWHYHYQKLIQHKAEAAICQWAIPLFPESYRAEWENWPPQATAHPPETGPDDPRLWGQLGKIYMLWGHSCLRSLREEKTTQGKENCLKEAVDKIALSLEYDLLLGSNTSALKRAEANLHDWLIRHGHEPLDGITVLEGFVQQTSEFCEEKEQCGRLKKFIEERFT